MAASMDNPGRRSGVTAVEDECMTLPQVELTTIDGKPASLADYSDQVLLVVNVASKCGFTPQYAALQRVYETYADRGFTVLGFPCNQFLFQEPGSSEDIAQFCSTSYGVTFPIFEKIKVRGRGQHPLYTELVKQKDAAGKAGGVKWNFEKFLVGRDGEIIGRFRTKVEPDDAEILTAIERALDAEAPVAYPADNVSAPAHNSERTG
jgi:glutathione peroxidase